MDRTASSLIKDFPSDKELIKTALVWLIKNKKYRDDHKSGRAAEYSNTWIRFITRCKEYKNKEKLIAAFRKSNIDLEIKTKLLATLEEPEEEFSLEDALKVFDGGL